MPASLILRLSSIAVLFAFASCAPNSGRPGTQYLGGTSGSPGTAPAKSGYDPVSYWDGDHASGSPSIHIDLAEQKALFYKGGMLVGVSQISSGKEGLDTPTGNYTIIQKEVEHRSNLYGDYVDAAGNIVVPNISPRTDPKPPGATYQGASMPYFMRLTNGGVGMHAGFLPGYPASHGCIRMPEKMAELYFANVAIGTPVVVTH